MSNSQSIMKRKIFNFDLSSCLGNVKRVIALVKRSCFGLKMIVSNVAVTSVYALWYITMCAGHVSQLLSIIPLFINIFENISVHLRNSSVGFTAMN